MCFSATYQWQIVFNAFGALAMAMTLFDVGGSVALRIAGNTARVLFVLIFCPVFDWLLKRVYRRDRKDSLPVSAF